MKNTIKDVTKEVWGELTIVGLLPSKKIGNSYYKQVECKCSCGNIRTADYKALKKGKIKSCGCLIKKTEVKTGDKYNHWTIVGETSPYKDKKGNTFKRVTAICICGKESNLTLSSLVCGKTKSCGCEVDYSNRLVTAESPISALDIAQVNKRDLGEWVVLKEVSYKRKKDLSIERILEVMCNCGYIKTCNYSSIGKSKSCFNCSIKNIKPRFTKEERCLKASIRGRYYGMIRRCYDSDNKSYISYGARGITVCDEWRDNYKSYYIWCLSQGLSFLNMSTLEVDRRDSSKEYSPDNCQIITKIENQLKQKYIDLTLKDVSFIRSDKFDMSMCSNYNCSKRVIKRIRNFEIFKNM
jgi:hypothetical protein